MGCSWLHSAHDQVLGWDNAGCHGRPPRHIHGSNSSSNSCGTSQGWAGSCFGRRILLPRYRFADTGSVRIHCSGLLDSTLAVLVLRGPGLHHVLFLALRLLVPFLGTHSTAGLAAGTVQPGGSSVGAELGSSVGVEVGMEYTLVAWVVGA